MRSHVNWLKLGLYGSDKRGLHFEIGLFLEEASDPSRIRTSPRHCDKASDSSIQTEGQTYLGHISNAEAWIQAAPPMDFLCAGPAETRGNAALGFFSLDSVKQPVISKSEASTAAC